MFDCDRAFVNTNNKENVFILLNKTILNILSSFIPHETLTVDDKYPPWFTRNIKNLIQEKKVFIEAIKIVTTIITQFLRKLKFLSFIELYYISTFITQLKNV